MTVYVLPCQGAAVKADADKKEAAKKEIAELMAKAKADMDKEDKKDEATAAQDKAEDLKKEVLNSVRLLPCPVLILCNLHGCNHWSFLCKARCHHSAQPC